MSETVVVANQDRECKVIMLGGVPLDESFAKNLDSIKPPNKDMPFWELLFQNGDQALTDGVVMIVHSQKAPVEMSGPNSKVIPIKK